MYSVKQYSEDRFAIVNEEGLIIGTADSWYDAEKIALLLREKVNLLREAAALRREIENLREQLDELIEYKFIVRSLEGQNPHGDLTVAQEEVENFVA